MRNKLFWGQVLFVLIFLIAILAGCGGNSQEQKPPVGHVGNDLSPVPTGLFLKDNTTHCVVTSETDKNYQGRWQQDNGNLSTDTVTRPYIASMHSICMNGVMAVYSYQPEKDLANISIQDHGTSYLCTDVLKDLYYAIGLEVTVNHYVCGRYQVVFAFYPPYGKATVAPHTIVIVPTSGNYVVIMKVSWGSIANIVTSLTGTKVKGVYVSRK